MVRLFLALALALPLFGGQSLRLTNSDTASITPPETATWQALGAFRAELFLKLTTCTSGEFFQLGAFVVNCSSANTIRMYTGVDQVLVDVTGRSEVMIRVQNDPAQTLATSNGANPLAHIEIWDADGTDYLAASQTASGSASDVSSIQSLTLTTIDIEIHSMKIYSTLIEKGINAPMPDPHGVGDLANWEFEGVLTDDGPDSMTVTASGHAFTTTAARNPVADPTVDADAYWMQQPSVRAGAEITLSADRSISHDDIDGLTCVWSDQGGGSGPTAIQFTGSTTACTTTAVFPTYGEYDLRLVVTDDGALTGTANVTVGAVATDSNRVVVMDNDAFAFTLGENIQWGQSAWPFLPERQYKMAEEFIASRSDPAWQTLGAGTVSVTNTSTTVTGSSSPVSTDFQNLVCSGGTTPDAGLLVIKDDAGLYWQLTVASCDSATQVTTNQAWNKTSDSLLEYSWWPSTNTTLWTDQSENENYYDNVLAYWILCKTSGFEWACQGARDLAALWWEMPYMTEGQAETGPRANNGRIPDPRRTALIGLMLWAKDQGTEADVFPGIEDVIQVFDGLWVTNSINYCAGDKREAWYVGMWLSLARELDIDAGRIANYESILTAAMDGSAGKTGGDIDPDICRYPNGGWPNHNATDALSGTVSVTNGSGTITCESTCGWDAGDVGRWVQVGILNNEDRSSDWGQYQITAQDSSTLTVTPNFAGTTGGGRWLFIGDENTYTHQTLMNAMPAWALDWQYRGGFSDYRQAMIDAVDYVEDKTYWAAKAGVYNLSDDAYCNYAQTNQISAESGDGSGCQYSESRTPPSQRFLSTEAMVALTHGVKYSRDLDPSGTAARIAFVDTLAGAAYGALGGPNSDTTWATEFNDNGATFTVGNGKQKNFGFCCGVGGSTKWDAERLGGLAAEDLVSYSVPLDIAGVSGATKASVTLYEPRGFSRVVNNQTGSSAAVTGDARQGDHLAVIEYKNAMDTVLETDYVMAQEAVASPAFSITGSTTFTGSFSF